MSSCFLPDRPLPLAAVFSVEGEVLTLAEKSLFSAAQPFGFILFGRNCKTPEQLQKLTAQLRSAVGWHCPIMIDQEGGRVARLQAPHWPVFNTARFYGEHQDVIAHDMRALAHMLFEMGIDANCAPVCDVLFPETHKVIGDRAYSDQPDDVAVAALKVALAFLDEGVQPIIKHLPGHGRAVCDSHLDLPVVSTSRRELACTDFVPFRTMAQSDLGTKLWGMVAHIIYTDIDPARPATLSSIVINNIIRGEIGFDGLLMTDDLDMKALENYGSIADRAEESLQAGCDLALYCWAKIDVMEQLAARLPPLSRKGWERWEKSLCKV
ncbi:MAG: beta-N-acetylhexosaminidase [Pseudobdellovibrionaceae bacterium]